MIDRTPFLRGYADPDVLYHNGIYYLYATSYSISDGYEVYASTDLVTWENHGNCLGGSFGLTRWFWAPDVKEKDGTFYMLASIDEHLGLLTASSPLGPFVPREGFLFDHSIDGHIFFEDDEMYIYYVSWREGHRYGIWGCRMMPDRITPDLSTETLLLVADQPYECHMNPVAEAPYLLKRDGVYYLTYSGSDYQSPFYCIAYATASSPLGPYTKYAGNPILVGDGKTVSGIGHHCIVLPAEGDEMLLIYHTHRAPEQIHPRDLRQGKIRFVTEKGVTTLRLGE